MEPNRFESKEIAEKIISEIDNGFSLILCARDRNLQRTEKK